MYQFKLPDLGEGIHEGEILQWFVKPGDNIKADDPLVEVETDKAAVTITSPVSGSVKSLNASPGDMVNVGEIIAVIDDGTGESIVEVTPAREERSVDYSSLAETDAPSLPRHSVAAAPATRRLARELGIDINQVKPTGPGGRVTIDDVHAFVGMEQSKDVPSIKHVEKLSPDDLKAQAEFAAHAASTIPLLDIEPLPDFSKQGPVEIEPLRSIRRKVAHKMVTSMVLIPHVSHMDEADVTLLEEFRLKERARREGETGGKLTLLAFVIRAVTYGLKAAPAFNASFDPFKGEIIYKKYYNIGFAVDTGKGLIVPVIKNTDKKTIIEISAEIEDKANRAREGKIEVDELQGGTFTITNIGPLGGTALLPTINYPEVAILAMGAAQDKAVVRNGEIVIRKILPLTFAFDHRIADGADAARFVAEMARKLSDPSLLLLET